MGTSSLLIKSFLLLILLRLSAARPPPSAATFLKSSCTTTTYPRLCYSSLSTFGSQIQPNPKSVATKSLAIALSAAKSASSAGWRLLRGPSRMPPAVADCAILLADAVKQLQRSAAAMGAGGAATAPEVGDVQTWASAALTDENTCMEEMSGVRDKEGKVVGLRRQVMEASQLTSNALALVNGYGSSRKRPRHHHPHQHDINHP